MINFYHDYFEYVYKYIRIIEKECRDFFALIPNIQVPRLIHVKVCKSKSNYLLKYINLLKR